MLSRIPGLKSRIGFAFSHVLVFFAQNLIKYGALGLSLGSGEGGLGTETLQGLPRPSGGLKNV